MILKADLISTLDSTHPEPDFFINLIASSVDAYLTVAKLSGIPSFIEFCGG